MSYLTPLQIKAVRKKLSMTQEQFAHKLGVSFATVNRWERGKTIPSPLALERLKQIQNEGNSNA